MYEQRSKNEGGTMVKMKTEELRKGRRNAERKKKMYTGQWRESKRQKKERRRAAQWRRRGRRWWRRKKGSRSKIKTERREMCEMKGKVDEMMQRMVEERKQK